MKTLTLVKPKAKTAKVKATADVIARYIAISAEMKKMTEEREALQAAIKSQMKNGLLTTPAGSAMLQERKKFTWTVEAAKKLFGPRWTRYATINSAMVKASTNPDIYTVATTEVTEALVVKATA